MAGFIRDDQSLKNFGAMIKTELSLFIKLLLAFAFATSAARPSPPADPVYTPLWLYNGNWQVTNLKQPAASKPDQLTNQCSLIGKYFACEQTVNGSVSALLVILPAKTAGAYYTQSIMPDGRAGGLGDLTVNGDKWVFSSRWNQGGKITYYKTTNTFMGKNHIHFEQQESDNNELWKTTNSGEEVRSAKGR